MGFLKGSFKAPEEMQLARPLECKSSHLHFRASGAVEELRRLELWREEVVRKAQPEALMAYPQGSTYANTADGQNPALPIIRNIP